MLGGLVGIPVYFLIEGFIRLLNLGRSAPPSPAERTVLAAAADIEGCEILRAVRSDRVRLVAPARLLPIGHRGITLGRTIFSKAAIDQERPGDREFFVHELVHVGQRERHGRAGMARRYAADWVDGFSYRDHAMEIEARAVAATALARWPSSS